MGSSDAVSMGGLDLLVCMQIQRNRRSETPGGHVDSWMSVTLIDLCGKNQFGLRISVSTCLFLFPAHFLTIYVFLLYCFALAVAHQSIAVMDPPYFLLKCAIFIRSIDAC